MVTQSNGFNNISVENPAGAGNSKALSLVISRQRMAALILSGSLLLSIVGPVIRGLPISELNRPLADYFSMFLFLIWMGLHVIHRSRLQIRPPIVLAILWLIPLSYLISYTGFVALGGHLSAKHLQGLIFSIRPIVFVQLTVYVCRWGRISGAWERRLLQMLWQTLAATVLYVSLLAILQFLQFKPIQNYIFTIYRYEKFLPRIAFDAALWRRATSVFHWFNSLGHYLTVATLSIYAYALAYRKGLTLWLIVAIGMIGLVLSGSRVSLIAVTIGVLLITLRLDPVKIFVVIPIGLLATVAAIAWVSARTDGTSRLVELWLFVSSAELPYTVAGRLNRWTDFLYYYRQNYRMFMLTGVTVTTDIDELMTHLRSFDSEYLRTYTYNGLVGLGMLMLYQVSLLAFIWRSTRRCRRIKHIRVLGTSLFAIFAIMPLVAFSQQAWTHIVIMNILFTFLGVFVYFQMNYLAERASYVHTRK